MLYRTGARLEMSTLTEAIAMAFRGHLGKNGLSMLEVAGERNLHKLLLASFLLLYLVLATAVSLTKTPICDEGWYADPAFNLIKNGSMGSPVIESAGGFLKGIDRYTYWEMPLHIVVQAG